MEKLIVDILKRYAEIDLVYIFGSYVTENYNAESDIDIAVYTSDRIEREVFYKMKIELIEKTEREIDLIDLRESNPTLNKEILFKGKNIYKRSEIVKLEFEYIKISELTQYSDDIQIIVDKIKERGYIYDRGNTTKNRVNRKMSEKNK